MGRLFLIASELIATILFLIDLDAARTWSAWLVPLILIGLVVINALWYTRLVAWIIFSVAFSSLLILLSAFTMRWRLEPGFNPMPFYRAMGMYTAFVYASLAQIKILSGPQPKSTRKLSEEQS